MERQLEMGVSKQRDHVSTYVVAAALFATCLVLFTFPPLFFFFFRELAMNNCKRDIEIDPKWKSKLPDRL